MKTYKTAPAMTQVGPSAAGASVKASGTVNAEETPRSTRTGAALRFVKTAISNPFVTGNVVILTGLGGLAIAKNGGGLWDTILSGDPLAIGMILAGQFVILGCSITSATLGTQAKVVESMNALERNQETLTVLGRQCQAVVRQVGELAEDVRGRPLDTVVRVNDTPEMWRKVTPQSHVIAIQPRSRSEVSEHRRADGQLCYTIDRQGMITTLKRYAPETGVHMADVVFAQPRAQISRGKVSEEMLRFSALYSATQTLSRNSGFSGGLDMSAIRIHIVAREEVEASSVFIIRAGFAGDFARHLVIRYDTVTEPLAPVFGRTLEIVSDQAEVDAAMINADRLIRSAERSMSLAELQQRCAGSLPHVSADLSPLTEEERLEIDWSYVGGDCGRAEDIIDMGDGSFSS